MKAKMLLALSILIGFSGITQADEKNGLHQDGFVQRWLVLAPFPLAEGENGEMAVAKERIKDEAKIKPKAGEKVKVGDVERTWKAHKSPDVMLNFNELLGKETENSVAYAVTYIIAAEDMKGVKMKTGSDDQIVVYLNGKQVFKYADERPADMDQDVTAVDLKKGVNVLAVRVVNISADWAFCVRFTDRNDRVLTNIKAQDSE